MSHRFCSKEDGKSMKSKKKDKKKDRKSKKNSTVTNAEVRHSALSRSVVDNSPWKFVSHTGSPRGGGEGLRVQSQQDQDYLCAPVVTDQLIFKTSTEYQSVDLTNKDMIKDSERFSP